jgi:hypothetical protein
MDILYKILLGAEISGLAIVGLIAVSKLMGYIRHKLSGPAPVFVPLIDVVKQEATASREGWAHRALVAFDIAFNVIVLRGQQDETISTHSGRAAAEGHLWGILMSGWLNGFQDNHCLKAASGDLERATARVTTLRKFLGV